MLTSSDESRSSSSNLEDSGSVPCCSPRTFFKRDIGDAFSPSSDGGSWMPKRVLLLRIISRYRASNVLFKRLVASLSPLPTSQISTTIQIMAPLGVSVQRIQDCVKSEFDSGPRSTYAPIHGVIWPDRHQQLFKKPSCTTKIVHMNQSVTNVSLTIVHFQSDRADLIRGWSMRKSAMELKSHNTATRVQARPRHP